MKIPKLKRSRAAEAKKIDLAEKYREQGKETGGGRMSIKKVRKTLEARNLPLTHRTPRPSGKQRSGRRRST
jgi:hypothetical protein